MVFVSVNLCEEEVVILLGGGGGLPSERTGV